MASSPRAKARLVRSYAHVFSVAYVRAKNAAFGSCGRQTTTFPSSWWSTPFLSHPNPFFQNPAPPTTRVEGWKLKPPKTQSALMVNSSVPTSVKEIDGARQHWQEEASSASGTQTWHAGHTNSWGRTSADIFWLWAVYSFAVKALYLRKEGF